MKKILSIFLAFNLALMGGCTGLIVEKGKTPVQIGESQVLFISRTPKGEYPRMKLSKNYRVVDVQNRIKNDLKNYELFINKEPVVFRNYGGKGKARKLYGPAYLGPGHIFAAKLISQNEKGRLYQAEFVGQCGNDIPPGELMILVSPDVWKYTDVDYTPALWAGLAGLLAGLGLGYLFWHGQTITTALGSSCPGCTAGTPSPRPIP